MVKFIEYSLLVIIFSKVYYLYNMKKGALVLCIKNEEVLLGHFKLGFNKGKYNGYGGKWENGETIEKTAIRELREESGIIAEEEDLEKHAINHFYFGNTHIMTGHIYILRSWRGEAIENEESKPAWFPVTKLPFDQMWAADREWLPRVLSGESFEATVQFNDDGSEFKNINFIERAF